jgi:hypothetical protein
MYQYPFDGRQTAMFILPSRSYSPGTGCLQEVPLIRKEAVVGAVQPVPANPITPGGGVFCKSESGQTNSSLQNFAAILSQVGRRILAFSSRSELRNFGFKQYWNRSRMSSILLNNWLLFRTSDESPNNAEPFVDDFADAEVPGIRCPLCNWRPKRSDAWVCCDCDRPEYFYGGCGTAWNTFEDRRRLSDVLTPVAMDSMLRMLHVVEAPRLV